LPECLPNYSLTSIECVPTNDKWKMTNGK